MSFSLSDFDFNSSSPAQIPVHAPTQSQAGFSRYDRPVLQPAHLNSDPFQHPAPLGDIERLELHELLKNPYVQDLYNRSSKSAMAILELTEQNSQLLKENKELKAAGHLGTHPDNFGVSRSTAWLGNMPPSIPAERPSCYPASIFWFEKDYAEDPDVKITKSNPNRKSMAAAIRHEDGSLISDAMYESLRATGRMIIFQEFVDLPRPTNKSGAVSSLTRTSLKQYHPKKWANAVTHFEEQQPLLSLCAGHWKAEHMLGNILNSLNQAEKGRLKRQSGSNTRKSTTSSDLTRNTSLADSASDGSIEDIVASSDASDIIAGIPNHLKRANDSSLLIGNPRETKKSKSSVGLLQANESLVKLTTLEDTSIAPTLGHGILDGSNVDVGFIVVKDSFEGLQEAMRDMFPHIQKGEDLLNAMKTYPNFARQDPSKIMLDFIQRIESADPNDKSLDDDNNGAGWGHYQFTAGSMTCASVITSWSDVGNTDIARRLIAASIRTAKVARYICEQRSITPTTFVSDIYVERIVDSLWAAWTSEPGSRTMATTTLNKTPNVTSSTSLHVPSQELSVGLSAAVVASPGGAGGDAENLDILKLLQNKELKLWIAQHGVQLDGPANKQRTNKELVSAILNHPTCPRPTQIDVQAFIGQRTARRKGGSGSKATTVNVVDSQSVESQPVAQ